MAETAEERPRVPRGRRRNVARIVVPIVIVMLLAAGGYYVWKRMNTYESTDDAQIDGHINYISNNVKAQNDLGRYKQLVDKDEIPRQQYDTAVSTAEAFKATLDARQASVAEAEQNIRVAQSLVEQANARLPQADASIQAAMTAPQQVAVSEARAKSAQAQVAQKRALLEQAKLNLSYCVIVAPVSGIVGKKTVETGQNISPGQQLMAVVPLDDVWVTANFKETQLSRMKPGQRVKFSVDAFGREYTGKLEAVGGASGSRFSLLPPENATGNYVKVVQRIPLKIVLDPGENNDRQLRPGMSVVPKVWIRQ